MLLSHGSVRGGARELKRTIHRLLTQPLAALVASAQIVPGTRVVVDAADAGTLSLTPVDVPASTMPPPRTNPRVLLLDDNAALLGWLEIGAQWRRSRRHQRRNGRESTGGSGGPAPRSRDARCRST